MIFLVFTHLYVCLIDCLFQSLTRHTILVPSNPHFAINTIRSEYLFYFFDMTEYLTDIMNMVLLIHS